MYTMPYVDEGFLNKENMYELVFTHLLIKTPSLPSSFTLHRFFIYNFFMMKDLYFMKLDAIPISTDVFHTKFSSMSSLQ